MSGDLIWSQKTLELALESVRLMYGVRELGLRARIEEAKEERDRFRAQVDDLAMLVRMLVHSARKTNPDNETARKAMDYLQRHNLQGSILRDILRDENDYGAGDCVPTER